MSKLFQYYNKEEQIVGAAIIVKKNLENLNCDNHFPLKILLEKYQSEMIFKKVNPIILNQLVLDISDCMVQNGIKLSKKESIHFKQLFNLIARGESIK